MEVSQNKESRIVSWLLNIHIFHKLLLLNTSIIILTWLVISIITLWHVHNFPGEIHLDLLIFFAIAGLTIASSITWLVFRFSLNPLDRLQTAFNDVQSGKKNTRISSANYSDKRFSRLIGSFNQMVTRIEGDSQRLHLQSGKILMAQEEERKRVARELHDEAAQSLTSILVRLRLLERSQDVEEAHREVQELRKLTSNTLDEIRRIALQLRPKILDDLGLESALSWQVENYSRAYATQINLQVTGLEGRLPSDLELVLYRVVQEALTNVAKYAHAKHISITLTGDKNNLELKVSDDGEGFEASMLPVDAPHGLGLLGMRERLMMVGGKLTVSSEPGKGTQIIAQIPLEYQ